MSCTWIKLWGGSGGQCWIGYSVLVNVSPQMHHPVGCWLVTGVSRTWFVFHISLSCWFAQQPTGSGGLTAVEMLFEFVPSPATNFSKSNNFQSFTLTKMGHVYHICLAVSKQTILANASVCNVLKQNVDHPTAIQDWTAMSWGYQWPLHWCIPHLKWLYYWEIKRNLQIYHIQWQILVFENLMQNFLCQVYSKLTVYTLC